MHICFPEVVLSGQRSTLCVYQSDQLKWQIPDLLISVVSDLEEKQVLEFTSDTYTSPSAFLWDLRMNVCKSQKCPLSLCISYVARYPTWHVCDLTFGDSELCWCNCHWNRKRCFFRKRASLALFFSYIELKIKENLGDNWLTANSFSLQTEYIIYTFL